MRKAALVYNPDSGGKRRKRQAELDAVMALLRGARVEVELMLPHSAAEAQAQVRHAIQTGCNTIFACGGDGTIHNVLQVLANTPAALAVLPMGTANALAHDLGLPMNVVAAARALLNAPPRRVALGRVRYRDFSGIPAERLFVVAAGIGVDAHLFYKLNTGVKNRMGMAAYYAKAWHMWFSHVMVRFQVEYREAGLSDLRRAHVTELMAVRIRNFGGVLNEFAPGASLDRNDLRLILCRTASRFAYLQYVTRTLLRRDRKVKGIDLAHSDRVSCSYVDGPDAVTANQPKVYLEADGELVGTLPAEITIIPDALTLLAPSH
jgi:diacylglycerol kinase (ATP)